MKRFGFITALLSPVAGLAGFEVARAHGAEPHTTVRGVRASVKAFRNSNGEVVGALDEHGNLGIAGAIRSVEIQGSVDSR